MSTETMKTTRHETTHGFFKTELLARREADRWRSPEMGYHAQAVRRRDGLWTVRIVING